VAGGCLHHSPNGQQDVDADTHTEADRHLRRHTTHIPTLHQHHLQPCVHTRSFSRAAFWQLGPSWWRESGCVVGREVKRRSLSRSREGGFFATIACSNLACAHTTQASHFRSRVLFSLATRWCTEPVGQRRRAPVGHVRGGQREKAHLFHHVDSFN